MRRFLFVLGALVLAFSLKGQNFRISGSNSHSVALCSDGTVFAWGKNDAGQLGLNPTTLVPYPGATSNIPLLVGGLGEIFQIDAGSGAHTLAMTCQGQVYAWGGNSTGQLGNTTVAIGAAGFSATPVLVQRGVAPDVLANGNLSGVIYVSGGNDESYAILGTQRLVAWGQNDRGQLGDGTLIQRLTPVWVTSGVTAHGQTANQPLENVEQVEAGDENGYALTSDGRVWSWGDAVNGVSLGRAVAGNTRARPVEIAGGGTLTNIVSITAGDRHALMIDDQGVVWSIGGDWGPGQRGNTVGWDASNFAVRVDAGAQFGGGTFLGDTDPIVEIAAGQAHSMAVSASGRVYTWGAQGFFNCGMGCATPSGQLGNGALPANNTAVGAELPVLATYAGGAVIDDATGVSDGDAWTFIINDQNEVHVAGFNGNGELGLGNTTPQARFVELDLASRGCGLDIPCPTVNLGLDFEVCPGFTHTLEAGLVYPGFTVSYYFNGVHQTADDVIVPWVFNGAPTQVPGYVVNQVGAWEVRISDNRVNTQRSCNPCPDAIDEINLSFYQANFSDPGDLEFCGTSSTVNVAEGGSANTQTNDYQWYTTQTGNTLLGSTVDVGTDIIDVFTAGVAMTGTDPNRIATVWVEDVSSFTGTVREVTSCNSGNAQAHRNEFQITVSSEIQFTSLDLYAQGNGNYTNFSVIISDNTGSRWNGSANVPFAGSVVYTSPGITGATTANSLIRVPMNYTLLPGVYWITTTNSPNVRAGCASSNPNLLNPNGDLVITSGDNVMDGNSVNNNGNPFYNLQFLGGSPFPCNRLPFEIVEKCPPCNKPTNVVIDNGATINICDVTPAVALDLEGTITHGTNPVQDRMTFVWYKDGTTPVAGDYTNLSSNTTTIVPPEVFTDPTLGDAGDWILRVEDGSVGDATCYTEATVTLNVGEVPTITGVNQTICSETSSTAINLSSSVPGSTYTWSRTLGTNVTGGTATGTTSTIPAIVFSNSGNTDGIVTYEVIPTGPTPTNCIGTAEDYVITVRPVPTVGAMTAQTICSGESTTLVTPTSPVSGTTFTWTSSQTGGITGMTASGTGDIPVQSLSAGTGTGGTVTYSVVPTNPGTPACPGTAVDFIVTVNPNPTVTIGTGGTYCPEDLVSEELTVTVSGGTATYTVTYNSPTLTGQTLSIPSGTSGDITGLTAGDYTLTRVEDVNGCFTTSVETRTIDVHPELIVTPISATCAAGGGVTATVLATLSGGFGDYSIDAQSPTAAPASAVLTPTGGASFTGTFDAAPAESYSYTFSDETGCIANTKTIMGSLDCDCPVVADISGTTEICPSESATLTVAVSGRRGAGTSTYSVTLSDGQTDTRVGPGDITFTVSPTATTTYTVTSVSDEICTGNPGVASAIVTVQDATVWDTDLDNTALTLCPGEPLNLQVLALGENIMYEWFQGTTSLGPASTTNTYDVASVISGAAGTTGIYSVNVTGTCGNLTSQTKDVTVAEDVVITTDLSTVLEDLCPGNGLSLEVIATGTPVGTNTQLTYAWTRITPLPVTSVGTDASTYTVASVAKVDSGDYQVTVTGRCGTAISVVTPVKVSEEVQIITPPVGSNLCPGDPLIINVEATGTPLDTESDLTYVWTKTLPTLSTVGLNQNSYEVTTTLPEVGVTALDAGSYQVSVEGKCNTVSSVVVDVIVGLTTEITVQPDSVQICAASNASFAVTAVGDNLTYSWSHTSTGGIVSTVGTDSPTFNVTGATLADAGEYTVEVTGTCGMVTSSVALLEITQTEFPAVTLTADKTTICEGDEVIFTAAGTAGGDMPTFEFFNGASSLQGPNGTNVFTLSNISADVTIEVEMTSNSGCIDGAAINPVRDSEMITVIDSAEASITVGGVLMTPIDTLLVSDPEVLNVTGVNATTTGSFIQTWSIATTTNTPTTDPVIVSPTTLVTDVTGLTTKDAVTFIKIEIQDVGGVCPVSTDSFPVSPKDLTAPVFNIPDMCETQLAHVATGNDVIPVIETPSIISYSLIGDLAGATLTNQRSLTIPVNTTPGDYTAGYQIYNSVSDVTTTATTNFTIYGEPTAALAGSDITTCAESVSLAGNVPTVGTGLWSCDAGTLTNPTSPTAQLSDLVNGTAVNCTWTTSNTLCPSTMDVVQITKQGDVTTPIISLDGVDVTGQELDICITDVRNLTGTAPNTSIGESAQWATIPGGTSVTGVNGIDPIHGNLSLQSVTPIQTIVSWTITSTVPNCDPETRILTLNVHDEPIAEIVSVSTNDTCANVGLIEVVTRDLGQTDVGTWSSSIVPSLVTPDSLNWSLSGVDLSTGNNRITYTVDNLGCDPMFDDEDINIDPMITPTITISTSPTVCVGSDVDFTTIVSGAGASPSYEWQYGNGPSQISINSTLNLVDVEESSFDVKVKLISSERCKTTDPDTSTVLVVVPGPNPEIITPDTLICITDPMTIFGEDLSGAPVTGYQWYRNGSPLAGETNIDRLENVFIEGSYTLGVTTSFCGSLISDPMILTVSRVPLVDASVNGVDPIDVFEGDKVNLSGDRNVGTAVWSNEGDLNIVQDMDDLQSPIITEETGGEYLAILTVTNGACSNADTVVVKIRIPIDAPNVFTVNGDGINETFHIKGLETYPLSTVTIYNRWGSKVYKRLNYTTDEWDGGESPEGAYYFIIDLGESDDEDEEFSGCIHLMR